MSNTTTEQTIERRAAIADSWTKGVRTYKDLAKLHNCDPETVKRDLAVLRRLSQRKVTDADINSIRREEDIALVNDIAKIEKLIEEARLYKPKKQRGTVEGGKIVQGSVEEGAVDLYSVIALIDRKLKIRRMRQELWGLISSQRGAVNVSVSAQASAGASVQEEKKDDDVPETIRRRIITVAEKAEAEASLGEQENAGS